MENILYQITFYVPSSHLESVKKAMFAEGAGIVGPYSHCAWQTRGEGQFLPLENSNPFIGETQELTRVEEYKVEMVCHQPYLHDVINALLASHPYEQPAYQVIQLIDIAY